MFQVGADGWKEGCTNIFFRASHIYYWSLGINFRAYAQMVKVDYLRREFLQTLFPFEMLLILLLWLCQGSAMNKRNGGINVCSQGMASMTRMWKRGRMEQKKQIVPDYGLRGTLQKNWQVVGEPLKWLCVCIRENICYLVKLL